MKSVLLVVLGILTASQVSFAMGSALTVFNVSNSGGIWDHSDEFYVNTSIKGLGAVWGGFNKVADGTFEGEIVTDQFMPTEKSYKATATLIHDDQNPIPMMNVKYFLIKVDGIQEEIIFKKN